MEQVRKDIEYCLSYLKRNKKIEFDGERDACFSFTNESLYLYYPYFDLKEKRILTVAGSGDHILEAINNGAKDITAFDQNRLTTYLLALKMGAIQSLAQKEFLSFFNIMSAHSYQYEYYQKIAPYLKGDNKFFWDSIFKENFDCGEIQSCFFYSGSPMYEYGEGSYLDKVCYNDMKDKISCANIHFMHIDLLQLPLKLNPHKPYDTMFLSNIYDWLPDKALTYGKKNNRRDSFEYFVEHELSPFLKEDGKCAFYAALWGKGWNFKNPCLYQDEKPLVYVYTKRKEDDEKCVR